ncbi:MAG: hypothetical protein EKK55_24330 [Rhodocyclaceae bacterium]|nr:MAG: hypothetical protein EKK55_24330 [Rhodocyclaceae bacterium]
MSTSSIRSIRVLKETSFGQLAAATLEPDLSAFDGEADVELDATRAELTVIGDAVVIEHDSPRGGFYDVPGDPESITAAAGGLYRVRRGALTLTIPLEGYGSADADDCPISWLLSAGLPGIDTSIASGPEAVASDATAQTFGVDDSSDWILGGLIGVTRIGKLLELSSIVELGVGTVGHSPAFGAELDGQTVRPLRTWSSKIASIGASLAFKIDGHGFRSYAFGCRPSSYSLKSNGRRIDLTVELQCALVVDDHANAGTDGANVGDQPFRSGGVVMHSMGAEVVVSGAIDTGAASYPRVTGRTVLSVDAWEATITNVLDPVGAAVSRSVLGMSEMEVVSRSAEVKLTVTPTATLDGALWDRSHRHLALGFGPGGAAGSGGGILLMGAFLKTDASKRITSNPRVQQELVFGAGAWRGDAGDATDVSNCAIKIGLVL